MTWKLIPYIVLLSSCLATAWSLAAMQDDDGSAQDEAAAGQQFSDVTSLSMTDGSAASKHSLVLINGFTERHPNVDRLANDFASAPNERTQFFEPLLAKHGLEFVGWNMRVKQVSKNDAGAEFVNLTVSAKVARQNRSPVTILQASFDEEWKVDGDECRFQGGSISPSGTGFVVGH